MNFNKYALVMFAIAGVMTIMIGAIGTSSAQDNQTSAGTTGTDNQTSAGTTGTDNQTSAGTTGTDNQTSAGTTGTDNQTSAGTNASGQTSANHTGFMDKLLKMFGMGGNK
jgi:hypothetical protein